MVKRVKIRGPVTGRVLAALEKVAMMPMPGGPVVEFELREDRAWLTVSLTHEVLVMTRTSLTESFPFDSFEQAPHLEDRTLLLIQHAIRRAYEAVINEAVTMEP